jgi:hypothetical protein
MNKSKITLAILALLSLLACASKKEPVIGQCSALIDMAFEIANDKSDPRSNTIITYKDSTCEDITAVYGNENKKVFFLDIDVDIYNAKEQRHSTSKDRVMISNRIIGNHSVIIFESPMVGVFYAFKEGESLPNLADLTYPQGYISLTGEIIGDNKNNQLTFEITQDLADIGNYRMYNLKKGSRITIDYTISHFKMT